MTLETSALTLIRSKQQAAQNAAKETLARFDAMASDMFGNDSQEAPTEESGQSASPSP